MAMVILLMDRAMVGLGNSSFFSAQYFDRLHQNPWISSTQHQASPSPTSFTSCPRCINTQQFIDGLDSELPRLRTNSNKEPIMPRSPMLLNTIHIADESCYDIGGNRRRKSLTECRPLESSEQPSSSGKEDASKPSEFTDNQELETKPIYNMSHSYLSVSQSSRRALRNATTLQLVNRPLQMKDLQGTTSLYMAFVAIMFAMATTFKNVKLIGTSNTPKTICVNCNGYGVTKCEICKGKGGVIWEGKWTHIDPCPLCFGSCTCKCRSCGGIRVRKDRPPFLQQYSKSNMKTKRL